MSHSTLKPSPDGAHGVHRSPLTEPEVLGEAQGSPVNFLLQSQTLWSRFSPAHGLRGTAPSRLEPRPPAPSRIFEVGG